MKGARGRALIQKQIEEKLEKLSDRRNERSPWKGIDTIHVSCSYNNFFM